MSGLQGVGSFSGISSGIDTEAVIHKLLQARKQPIRRLEQRISQQETIDEAWTTVSSKLSSVRDAAEAARGATSFEELTTASSSNQEILTASATGPDAEGKMTFSVEQLARTHQLAGGSFAATDSEVGQGQLTVDWASAGTDTIDVAQGTTLSELADRIDSEIAGVSARAVKFSDGDHRLMLESDQTGADQAFDVTSTPDGFTTGFSAIHQAADAELAMGGTTITRSTNQIDDLMADVTIDLQQASPGEDVTITATRDTGAAAQQATDMVEALGKALASLGELTGSKVSDNGQEVETGPLQGDATARRITDQLRRMLTESRQVDGETVTASEMGIEANADGGLELDEAAVKQAFEQDFDRAAAFFGGDGTTEEGPGAGMAGALVGRLDSIEGPGGDIDRARDAVERRINSHEDRIEQFQLRVEGYERTLRDQFTRMETRLSQLQQMQSRMQQSMGGLV